MQNALLDWNFAHSKEKGFQHADPKKIGYKIESPVVNDNAGKVYLCELVETHYNPQQDVLIFVWKPAFEASELPAALQAVPDHDPNLPLYRFAGEQETAAISIGKPKTEA